MLALDEKTYELNATDLVIADGKEPVAIAGIMGGQMSGVSTSTRNQLQTLTKQTLTRLNKLQ